MFATVDRDSVTVFNITSSGQSGGTGSSVSTVQGQNAQFSDGEPVLVYDSSAAGQDLALTVWIELAPGVSVGGAQVSRGTIATADNRVVWRGFSLGGGAQARVNLNVAPSGISHPIRRVTVESVSTEQGEQRVTVLTPKQSGARLSAGTPRLPNTGTGGLLQPGGLASRWLAVTEVVVMLLLGVGLWSWTRLRGRQS